jgi:Ca2+-binding EF-hand superfamily protein
MLLKAAGLITLLSTLISTASGHGSHQDAQSVGGEKDWATEHMREEHHIDGFDAGSFFALHDYDNSGAWTPDEIRKTYGLEDRSSTHISEQQKEDVVRRVLALFDPVNSGMVSRDDWIRLVTAGVRLPDFGFGPGHHGDIEYEYEIHHYEKYHGEDTKEEDLIHPEDVEHFKLHDEEEAAQIKLEQLERMTIVEANIPLKFQRAT